MVAGIIANKLLFPRIEGWIWITGSLALLLLSVMLYIFKKRIPANLTLLCSFALLSAGNTFYSSYKQKKSWIGHWEKNANAYLVCVTSTPEIKPKTIYVPVSITHALVNNKWENISGHANIYVYKNDADSTIKKGNTYLIDATKIIKIPVGTNPFAFNFATYWQRKGITHTAFISHNDWMIIQNNKTPESNIMVLRNHLHNSIYTNVKDSTTAALIAATLLNERNNLKDELFQAYSVTGIVHIIAISGMHISMLSGILLFILKLLPDNRFRMVKYLAAALLVWVYIAITGFPASAVRAGVMFSILTLSIASNRKSIAINTWAATGVGLLIYNPDWLYDVGAQLSFLAVLSILLFFKSISNLYQPTNSILKILRDTVSISIAAQILVFPLVIFYFHQFPIWSIIVNIPAALFSTILMVGALFIFFLQGIGISCIWLGNLLSILTNGFNAIVVFFSELTPNAMRALFLDEFQFTVLMLSLICLCIYLLRHNKTGLSLSLSFGLGIILITDLIIRDIAALGQERIIVYESDKAGLVDVIKGKSTIHSVKENSTDFSKHSIPAMLGYRAFADQKFNDAQQLFHINHKKILLLKNTLPETEKPFVVDVLIVSKQSPFRAEIWQKCFSPKLIVIDGSLSRYTSKKWKDLLTQSGANVHSVNEDGAWIYPR